MEYFWLFFSMFFVIIFDTIVIFYLLAKYKDARANATRWLPPF